MGKGDVRQHRVRIVEVVRDDEDPARRCPLGMHDAKTDHDAEDGKQDGTQDFSRPPADRVALEIRGWVAR
jgi:hypothetical protein